MTCLEENTLFEYLCGGLPLGARDAVAEHAAVCAGCRRMLAAAVDAHDLPAPGPCEAHAGRPGRLLAGKYRLLDLLGAGGMGTVHEAVNTWTGRRVAVKQLRGAYAGDDLATHRFLREARCASRIAHPNVVDVLDLGRDPETGALFMVQELLTGVTLRHRLAERGALPAGEVVQVIVPALAALVTAHTAGVVHRDLKPDNIFLARDAAGREIPKLIDFGLSKQLCGDGDPTLTLRGHRIGTPFYMSPEQLRGDADLDGRTDVWSIGVVLFEAVAGVRPFAGPAYDQLILQILRGPVPRLADLVRGVSPAFSAVVERALDRDRGRRPSSAELHRALAELHRDLRSGAGAACRSARRAAVPRRPRARG